MRSELPTHNRGLNMLFCTSRNNIQAPVLAGAACGALQSRVPARVFLRNRRMGLRRRKRGWRRPAGQVAAATSALASVVVPEAAAAAAGSMAANSAAAAAARAMAARAAAAGGGGNCRRAGLAWKGALNWMSGRSCWSRASRGAPSRLLPRATPSAGSVASLRTAVDIDV